MANAPDVNSDEYFETYNPWHIEYLHDEWGEDDTTYPFLSTYLQGTGWNIKLDYMPPTSENPNGLFRLQLVDEDGQSKDMFGPVNILIRGSDGETKAVPVTGVAHGIAFVEDPATVEGLKWYLNKDNFDILMEFEKYNERHRTKARWESTPGFFQSAIDIML